MENMSNPCHWELYVSLCDELQMFQNRPEWLHNGATKWRSPESHNVTLFCSLLWLWPFVLPHRLLWCYAWFLIRETVHRMDTLEWFLWWPDFSVSWHFIFSWKETLLGLMANVATRSFSVCQGWESFLWLGAVMFIFVHIFVFWLTAYSSCRNCAILSQDWPFS